MKNRDKPFGRAPRRPTDRGLVLLAIRPRASAQVVAELLRSAAIGRRVSRCEENCSGEIFSAVQREQPDWLVCDHPEIMPMVSRMLQQWPDLQILCIENDTMRLYQRQGIGVSVDTSLDGIVSLVAGWDVGHMPLDVGPLLRDWLLGTPTDVNHGQLKERRVSRGSC